MDTGEKLRLWRERNGLSQEKAAKRIGAKQRTWASWEKDGATPEVDFAEAIERLTGGEVAIGDWVRSRRRKRRTESLPRTGTDG